MNNKNKIYILTVTTILLISFLVYFLFQLSYEKKVKETRQNEIDKLVQSHLSLAYSYFSSDSNLKTNYAKVMDNVTTTSTISTLSSYDKKNDILDVSLQGFYSIMLDNNRDKIIAKRQELSNVFMKLSNNPSDVDAVNQLLALINNISDENKK